MPAPFRFDFSLAFSEAFFVKFGIERIKVAFVELVGQQPQVFAEALIVHDLTFAQKADRVLHVRVVRQPQDIVVGGARFLLP